MLISPKKERSRYCLPRDESTPPPMKQSCKIKKHALNVMKSPNLDPTTKFIGNTKEHVKNKREMQLTKFRLWEPLQNKDSISSISTWRKKQDRRGTYWLKETKETCQLIAMNGTLDPDSKKQAVRKKQTTNP